MTDHVGVEDGAAFCYLDYGVDEVADVSDPALEQVADASGCPGEQLCREAGLDVLDWMASPALIGATRSARCCQVGSRTRLLTARTTYISVRTMAIAVAVSRTAAATPRLNRATRTRYRTEPAAARSVGPWVIDSGTKPCSTVKPLPGRKKRRRPAAGPRTARCRR